MPTLKLPIATKTFLYCLLAIFAAFASYRLHLEGFEEIVAQGLNDIVNFEGRAPDQYRVLPYLLLGVIRDVFEFLGDSASGWKYPILLFESTSIFVAICILDKLLANNAFKTYVLISVFLIYPYLMFDGVRSIAAFVLMLSALITYLGTLSYSIRRDLWFFIILLALSFTRADIALFVGMISCVNMHMGIPKKFIVVAIPIGTQLLLMNYVFPDAEYYSDVVMIKGNLTLLYFIGNPLTYFFIGLAIYFKSQLLDFFKYAIEKQKPELTILVGYIVLVFIVGRPNEYRLFLPFLPAVLVMIQQQKIKFEKTGISTSN